MNYFLYAMIYILVFLMGVTVFSYLNLVIERLPKKEKLTIRHSHCKQCDHEQTWKDVIPIFSRIRYQNRCRYCGSVLPKRPLIIELAGGAFAAFSVITVGVGLPFVFAQGGDPVVCSVLALTAGYCGTLLTPMAANFNILPAALLELKDKNAVIKAQAPIAIILLVIHIFLMYTLGF